MFERVGSMDATCDGVWVLQTLLGLEQLPASLLLLPVAPGASELVRDELLEPLKTAGIVSDEGAVHPQVVAWMTALARPDIELAVQVDGPTRARAVIVRSGSLHVAAVRVGDDVAIYPVPGISTVWELAECAQSLLPPGVPSTAGAISMRQDELLGAVARMIDDDTISPRLELERMGLRQDQAQVLAAAIDTPTMEAAFTFTNYRAGEPLVSAVGAAVVDTDDGRVVVGPARAGDGTEQTNVLPGTPGRISDAIVSAAERLPAGRGWFDADRM